MLDGSRCGSFLHLLEYSGRKLPIKIGTGADSLSLEVDNCCCVVIIGFVGFVTIVDCYGVSYPRRCR